MRRIDSFRQALRERRAVKVISGINNHDLDRVRMVVAAAIEGKAHAVDVSAHREVLEMVTDMMKTSNTDMALFASSIVPMELAEAVNKFRVDAIELGNFDALYKDGISMTGSRVLELVRETLSLVDKEQVFFSVTIPGTLSVTEQIDLARELEALNIDVIQTEGYVSEVNNFEGARAWLNRAELTISNTLELSRNMETPVMTASNINTTTAAIAFAAGASAIGCGSCVNRLESSISMLAAVRSLVEIAERNIVRHHSMV